MDQQGSTPDTTAGGITPSLPSSADNAGVTPVAQPSQPAAPGDLFSNLQEEIQKESTGSTPSQPTQEDVTPQQQPQNQGQAQTGDSVDPELVKWASSQNLTLSTPAEINLAKRLRDTQTALHQANNQRIHQPVQEDEFADPLEQKVDVVSRQLARYEFFERNPEAKALENDMIDFAVGLRDSGDIAAYEFYRNNWDHLYRAVKASAPSVDTGELIDQGRQQERESLARAQQASAPRAAAVSSAPTPKGDVDAEVAKMTPQQYDEWRKTNNPFAF